MADALCFAGPSASKQPCQFWHFGGCSKGLACDFSHASEPASKLLPCKFFAAGRCSKGQACHFSHDPGRVAPCRQHVLYLSCAIPGCRFSHKSLKPDIALVLIRYFGDQWHKQLQRQHQQQELVDVDSSLQPQLKSSQEQQQQQHVAAAGRAAQGPPASGVYQHAAAAADGGVVLLSCCPLL